MTFADILMSVLVNKGVHQGILCQRDGLDDIRERILKTIKQQNK